MLIIPKHTKTDGRGHFYGFPDDKNPAPARVSVASFDTSFVGEPLHYSRAQIKLYVIHHGEGILEVEGKEVPMTPESMIVVQPGEKHRVLKVQTRLEFTVVMLGPENDKVVVSE